VRKNENLEILHFMGEAYGQRPSKIVGVEDDWAAYQLDMVTLIVGRRAEDRIANESPKRRGKAKKATKTDLMMLGIGVDHG
jgi:hypothetical protein